MGELSVNICVVPNSKTFAALAAMFNLATVFAAGGCEGHTPEAAASNPETDGSSPSPLPNSEPRDAYDDAEMLDAGYPAGHDDGIYPDGGAE